MPSDAGATASASIDGIASAVGTAQLARPQGAAGLGVYGRNAAERFVSGMPDARPRPGPFDQAPAVAA